MGLPSFVPEKGHGCIQNGTGNRPLLQGLTGHGYVPGLWEPYDREVLISLG